MRSRSVLILAALVGTLAAGVSAAQLSEGTYGAPRPGISLVTGMTADEGVPWNMIIAMNPDEGVPQSLVTAMKADEGVSQNLMRG
jgi:hypothetical protein